MNDILLDKSRFGYKISRRDTEASRSKIIPVGAIIWYSDYILIAGVLRHIDVETILNHWKTIIHPELLNRKIITRYYPSYYYSVGYDKSTKRIYSAFESIKQAKKHYSIYSNHCVRTNNAYQKPKLFIKTVHH
jgi:hypothetical protein